MKVFVVMADGTYCPVAGVRKIMFVKQDVWFMHPDGAPAEGETRTFMELRGFSRLKASFDLSDVVATYSNN